MRMRRKKHQQARLDDCSELLVKDHFCHKGSWRELFSGLGRELYLELGCGKGAFIVKTALENPDKLYVAMEKLESVLLLALERAKRAGVKNLLFVNGDAACVCDMFGEREINGIFINFPDPWPHARHAKRRLTHERAAAGYKNLLAEGGELALKTDSEPLFSFSLQTLEDCGFETVFKTFDLHQNGRCGVMTEYETRFFDQNKPIMRGVFRVRSDTINREVSQ